MLSYQPSEIFPSSLDINKIAWDDVPIAASVSDVGRIKMPSQFEGLALQGINRYDGRIFTFITVLENKMFINLMYQEALYNKLDMNTLLDNTLLELKHALN